ncbi:MAG TPA: HEPN domain-containing protein [Candidatus Omnitrophota bacterium]|nr:HEPN domain-containing protein [Candidatus Omnitrophota bacterium]HPD85594.1 HEPN domain-containing protein [Candidatus Omnitrophota bacterium]HRZ04522.1 HEPN domain-containing protein [Candidatus Omnitrophota bacterium]
MGKGIEDQDLKECLSKGKIKKFAAAVKLAPKELKTARDDLKTAENSFDDGSFKWATIQGYYAMFHAARALIYSKGYRERSHYCLIAAIKAFFVAKGLLDVNLIEALQTAKTLRENADYENEFSKEGARNLLDKAKELLGRANEILENAK